jgi:hypothetical protein
MIPVEMTGAWLRVSISLDGAAPGEESLVWWLQAPTRHCDLRVPLEPGSGVGVMCFAGTTSWADQSLTWTPDLELDPSIDEDIGVITWDGDDMLEAGTFDDNGRIVSYVERWRRLPDGDGIQLALSSPGGRLVRTGPYALTIVDERPAGGSFAAVAWTLQDGGWTVDHSWPAGATAPAPPSAITDGDPTVLLDDGTEWIIDEHRKVADISG